MKFSTITLAIVVFFTTLASSTMMVIAEQPQITGGILSNVDSVSQLSPHIILDYLIECTNVSNIINVLPEKVGCLLDNYFQLTFPGKEFGDMCSSPDITPSQIGMTLVAADDLCPEDDFSFYHGTATWLIYQVLLADSCWQSLCQQDSLARVESHFVEKCSGVDLPYPLDSSSMLEQEEDNAILTCMLDYVMDTTDSCHPPAYDNAVCPDSLAKPAFDFCTQDKVFLDGMMNENLMFMSMSMSMSMNVVDDSDVGDKHVNESLLLERFCAILDDLNTAESLECLDMICDNPSTMPSVFPSPTSSPSQTSSVMPSSMPSQAASSSMPSARPSLRPSTFPSLESSTVPSLVPSSAPSDVLLDSPTASPSSAPSSAPTRIVSNPEGVQSSATTAVAPISLVFLVVAALFVL